MKRIGWCLVAVVMMATPIWAKKTEELLEMETEALFELSLDELLDREITSAGKMAEKVGEIPASIYIVTREEIETYGYRTVAEAIRNIPGFYTIYNYAEDFIGVRGQLNDDNIILLVNGVVQHTTSLSDIMMPTDAIDRIEVVRGPMSVIYGSGAFLGSINIVTNQIPYGEPGNTVSVSTGSADTFISFARLSREGESFRYVLNGTIYTTDGLEENYAEMMSAEMFAQIDPLAHKDTDGDLGRKNGNVNFSGTFGDIYVDFQYNRTRQGYFNGSPPYSGGSFLESRVATGQVGYRRIITDSVEIDARFTYSDRDVREVDKGLPPEFFGPGAETTVDGDEERFEAELDMIWRPNPAFNMIAGINYKRYFGTEWEVRIPDPLIPDIVLIDAIMAEISERDTRALFLQANYRPLERLKLTAGARIEQYLSYEANVRTILNEAPFTSVSTSANNDEDVHFIPRIAAVYTINDHNVLKLMYGEANRPFNPEDIDLGDVAAGDEAGLDFDLEPEEIQTIEANYLLSYTDFGLSFSLFRNNIENLIVPRFEEAGDGTFSVAYENVGSLVTYGGEVILFLRPTKPLLLELSATYQETEDKNEESRSIEFSPNLLLKAKADYQWRNLTFGLSALYVDDMSPLPAPPIPGFEFGKPVDAYVITDLNLRYHDPGSGFFAGLRISNLFDEEVRYPATQNANFENGLIDEGLAVLATVGWKF